MASEPLSDPDHGSDVAALRAERDVLARRLRETEQIVEDLADQLARARAELAATGAREQEEHLALFGQAPAHSKPTLTRRGSDAGVLTVGLSASAVVALMVCALSWINSGFATIVTISTLAAALVLGVLAWRSRVFLTDVSVDDGVVHITSRGTTHRFDLRNESTRFEVHGQLGEPQWEVRFLRRALDPMVVDASMVNPRRFLGQLRSERPDI